MIQHEHNRQADFGAFGGGAGWCRSWSRSVALLAFLVGSFFVGEAAFSPAMAQFTISQVKNLQFGNVIVGDAAGSVTVPSVGPAIATSGLFLRGPEQPAEFQLAGPVGTTFFIILPATASVSSGFESMLIRDFEASIERGTTTGAANPILIKIGATIDIAQNEIPNVYNGTFMFTVQENQN